MRTEQNLEVVCVEDTPITERKRIIFHKKRQVANEKEVPFVVIVALPT